MEPFVRTYTGVEFHIFNPHVDEIDIWDIARSLSYQCRFNGHAEDFYSVAQHSVIIAALVPEEIRLEALLHDAAEAYIGDMPSPVKERMTQFKELEQSIECVIAERFGLVYPWPPRVKEIDKAIIPFEADRLLKGVAFRNGHLPMKRGDLDIQIWTCWRPEEAERRFIEAYSHAIATRTVRDPWHVRTIARRKSAKL